MVSITTWSIVACTLSRSMHMHCLPLSWPWASELLAWRSEDRRGRRWCYSCNLDTWIWRATPTINESTVQQTTEATFPRINNLSQLLFHECWKKILTLTFQFRFLEILPHATLVNNSSMRKSSSSGRTFFNYFSGMELPGIWVLNFDEEWWVECIPEGLNKLRKKITQ